MALPVFKTGGRPVGLRCVRFARPSATSLLPRIPALEQLNQEALDLFVPNDVNLIPEMAKSHDEGSDAGVHSNTQSLAHLATSDIPDHWLAYIAGLFDGEGHIGFYTYKASKNGQRYARLVLGITNSYRPVLDWVRKIVGAGRIHLKRRQGDWKDCYTYILQGMRARTFLTALLPYLKVKHARALDVLSRRTYGRVR